MTTEMKIDAPVLKAVELLHKNGYAAYLVGGCVRDFVMGKTPDDFDVATACPAEKMKEIFSSYRCILAGLKHGTVTPVIDRTPVECTTFRIDGSYLDSRHPESVVFSENLKDDLSRRDFTVNAMAYDVKTGQVIDCFGGRDDIENKIIRTVGEPDKRFGEDALRMLRALRFSSKLGFTVEEKTKESILRLYPSIEKISLERISAETVKIFNGENTICVLENFAPVMEFILPGLKVTDEYKRLIARNPGDGFSALVFTAEAVGADRLFEKLQLTKREKTDIKYILQNGDVKTKTELKYFINGSSFDCAEKLLKIKKSDKLNTALKEICENNECCFLKDLAINGEDLKDMGFSGRKTGRALEETLKAVIEGRLPNEKASLLAAVT